MNQITIGRNSNSTIVVSSQYSTVSGDHATITKDGNSYILEDHSTNGTYVNGARIHHSSCRIQPNDHITLGHQYVLNFSEVRARLEPGHQTQRMPHAPQTERVAQVQMPIYQQNNIHVGDYQHGSSQQRETPACLNKWNWGAFFWGWIWGIGNGVYWPLVTLIPYVGQLASIIIIFILGANGSRYAWDNFSGSAAEFDAKQHRWAVAAGIAFLVSIALGVIVAVILIAAEY